MPKNDEDLLIISEKPAAEETAVIEPVEKKDEEEFLIRFDDDAPAEPVVTESVETANDDLLEFNLEPTPTVDTHFTAEKAEDSLLTFEAEPTEPVQEDTVENMLSDTDTQISVEEEVVGEVLETTQDESMASILEATIQKFELREDSIENEVSSMQADIKELKAKLKADEAALSELKAEQKNLAANKKTLVDMKEKAANAA